MISIAIATAAAGVIVGSLSLPGAHQVILEFVEAISGGNLMLLLILVAVMSLVLGMGLPTTANYIVVSSLMAPVIVKLGAMSGLIIPIVAAHLFVFYFGILADDTPPVGLAAFAAAAISCGDPIKTGVQGFMYDIRTALLPFLFVVNTELLLIDVTLGKAVFVFIIATMAMILFAAATQGYFFALNYVWKTVALLLIAFTLFRPGFWLDQVTPKYDERAGIKIVELAEKLPANSELRLKVSGPNINDDAKIDTSTLVVPLGPSGKGADRLSKSGIAVLMEDGLAKLEEPLPASKFEKQMSSYDFYGDKPIVVTVVQIPNERMPKEVFYIPALLLFLLVILLQRRRQTQPAF